MHTQKIIEEAVGAGWRSCHCCDIDADSDYGYGICRYGSQERALLDPLFWQALGKARGWDKNPSIKCQMCNRGFTHPAWLYHQHSLIDALASGQSVEDFFSKL